MVDPTIYMSGKGNYPYFGMECNPSLDFHKELWALFPPKSTSRIKKSWSVFLNHGFRGGGDGGLHFYTLASNLPGQLGKVLPGLVYFV